MQQLLPLMLDWLSSSPDPDLGLLQLRNLLASKTPPGSVVEAFRESPEAARRLCSILGTSRLLGDTVAHNPDLVDRLPRRRAARDETARRARRQRGRRPRRGATSRPNARTRCAAGTSATGSGSRPATCSTSPTSRRSGRDLAALGEAVLEVALRSLDPQVPLAVLALGRFGGAELSYASDLDVIFVFDGSGRGRRRPRPIGWPPR